MENFTIEDIKRQHEKVVNNSKYGNDIRLLKEIIEMYPKNDDLKWIAIKISVVNLTNSTQLSNYKSKFSLYDIAKIILDLKIDGCIKAGNPEVVSRIARECKRRYGVNLFSFASKYCVYHNIFAYGKDDFSIFDNIVSKNLYRYSTNLDKTQPEQWRKKIMYKKFNDCIGKILNEKGIKEDGRRMMFDHYVWNKNRSKILDTMDMISPNHE